MRPKRPLNQVERAAGFLDWNLLLGLVSQAFDRVALATWRACFVFGGVLGGVSPPSPPGGFRVNRNC